MKGMVVQEGEAWDSVFAEDLMNHLFERKKNDEFKIKFYNEIDARNFKDKFELTEKLNKILEEMIIYKPDQWIWSHNRWK